MISGYKRVNSCLEQLVFKQNKIKGGPIYRVVDGKVTVANKETDPLLKTAEKPK